MSDQKITILQPVDWFSAVPCRLSAEMTDWLMERGSMTERFERHCRQVTVEPYQQRFVLPPALPEDERALLPASERYWLREIVLYGDGIPWLIGRTLIPQQTLSGPELGLLDIGTVPLGRYLFSCDRLTRDAIQVGQQGSLWARRSSLRLAGKPLLLTELFLPDAPPYHLNSG